MIKLQTIEDYKHRDGSISKQLPHGNVWVRPAHIVTIEHIAGVTSVLVGVPTGGYTAYSKYMVGETPEQILEMMRAPSAV